MKKIITSFFFILLIFEGSYAQEKKTITKKAYKVSPAYKETRKIKYLLQEPSGVVAFFDNNKATLIKDFKLCKENMSILYLEPSEYDYEIIAGIISFSKKEDKYASGVKLSSDYWIIKNYVQIVEIQNCN